MPLFSLYRSVDDPVALPEAVPEEFSWFATLLPPVHALAHRLWDQLALFVAGMLTIVLVAPLVGPDAAIWLYILLAIACGFAAPGAQRRALQRRGYASLGHRFAGDAESALVAVMETRS